MGSGIGSLDDVYDTTVAYEKGVCCCGHDVLLSTNWSRATERSHRSLFHGY
jgi:hypothetical protein